MSKISDRFDIDPEESWWIERDWFKVNFHSNGPFHGMYDDGSHHSRTLASHFYSKDIDVSLLEHCFYRLMEYVTADKEVILTALHTVNEIVLAGIESLGIEYEDKLVEKTGSLLRKQYARGLMPERSSQWITVSYPVFMKSKDEGTLWRIEESMCEIQNRTQWTAQRVVNEAFMRGIKELVRKKCRVKLNALIGSGDFSGETPVWIYGLVDPNDGEVHYIGRSKHPFVRLEQHLEDAGNGSEKGRWLTSLTEDSLQPDIRILDCVAESEADAVETDYINAGLSKRWPLTNVRGAK